MNVNQSIRLNEMEKKNISNPIYCKNIEKERLKLKKIEWKLNTYMCTESKIN